MARCVCVLLALPKSPLGQAITYARINWAALGRYLEEGWLPIDNVISSYYTSYVGLRLSARSGSFYSRGFLDPPQQFR